MSRIYDRFDSNYYLDFELFTFRIRNQPEYTREIDTRVACGKMQKAL